MAATSTTATVLFTDLVGSTALRSGLGEEAFEALRRTHDGLVRRAITTHSGTVVKGLGDGAMATFAGSADAVAAAVAIQQAIAVHNRRPRTSPLAVRVGVSAGDVLWEGGDCYGLPVVEASRLCAAADGGTIIVSEVVRLMARGRGGWAFTSMGLVELKGLSEPLAACTVMWEPLPEASAEGHVPLPPLLARAEQFRFAGRAAELDTVLAAWKAVEGGTSRALFIAGEPGIGKTRLMAELARAAHAAGALVLYGHSDDELGVPFQPFAETLAYYTTHEPTPSLGRHAGDLVRLLPELAGQVAGLPAPLQSDPETERYRLFEAVAAWLAAASAAQPLLLVLDDLHWAAKPTLLLLRHVLRATAAAPAARLLILAAYRDTDLERAHPLAELLADLHRSGAERLALRGLDEAGVVELIERTAGQTLAADGLAIARTVHRETEGNPFFIGEVIRHLAETGAIVRRDDGWALAGPLQDTGIPEGVRDVIGRRLARLSETANRALTVAAVIGRGFDLGVLAAVSEIGEEALLDALEPAVAARLLDETGADTYRFAHALVRETLYAELSASRRVRWHRRIAEAMTARRPDDLAALAYHYGQAAVGGDIERAVEYATRAGDQAHARLAHDQALAYYRQALALLDTVGLAAPTRQRCELLIRRGEAERNAGDAAYRETLLGAARLAQELRDPDLLVRAALANNRGWTSATGLVDADRVAVLEAALAAAGTTDSPERARLLATLAAELMSEREVARRRALSDDALSTARRVSDPSTLAHVLGLRFVALLAPDTLAERTANTEEAIALAEQLRDPARAFLAVSCRAWAAVEAADIDAVDRHLDAAQRLAGELGQPYHASLVARQRSWRAWLAGDLAGAEVFANQQLAIGRATGQPEAFVIYGAQLWMIRFAQGRLAEIEPLWAQAMIDNPHMQGIRPTLAYTYCELGRESDASSLLAADVDAGFTAYPFDYVWLINMTSCARVMAHLGYRDSAQVLYERLRPWETIVAFSGVGVSGPTAGHLALLATTLGRYDDAERHFATAVDLNERLRCPFSLASTRLGCARMLLRRRAAGAADRARALLDEVLGAARRYGFARLEQQAIELSTS